MRLDQLPSPCSAGASAEPTMKYSTVSFASTSRSRTGPIAAMSSSSILPARDDMLPRKNWRTVSVEPAALYARLRAANAQGLAGRQSLALADRGLEVALYDPRALRRLEVKPGLTCIWQISGRNDIDFDRWMQLDLEYIEDVVADVVGWYPTAADYRGLTPARLLDNARFGERLLFEVDQQPHWLAETARKANRRWCVRLVKGAYWDSEIKRSQEQGLPGYPVYTRKPNTDVSYLACARRMLAADLSAPLTERQFIDACSIGARAPRSTALRTLRFEPHQFHRVRVESLWPRWCHQGSQSDCN